MVDNNAPRRPDGKLMGWGVGGIINPPGASVKDPKGRKSVHLQANIGDAQVVTVMFEMGPPEQNGTNLAANVPVAEIAFSTNGVTVNRKITMVNGASISGPAQTVEIIAFDESQDAASAPYECNISVTPGTRGGQDFPTLQDQASQSFGAGSGTAGSGIYFDIPLDVGAIAFRLLVWNETSSINLDDIIVRQVTPADGTVDAFQNPNEAGWVPIAPTAVRIEVGSFNGSNGGEVAIIFMIDG